MTGKKYVVAGALALGALAVGGRAHAAEYGRASWYQSGRRTANGEIFEPDGNTCARRRERFGVMLRVTDLKTNKSIICRVNDRGPAARTHRAIDLSRGSARRLGILSRGEANVKIEVVQ